MYIGCRAVIISIFITFLLLCSPCSAENPYLDLMVTTHELVAEKTFNGFTTSWYYSPGLTNQEYIIAIQNLEDENRETNITSLISNTNFNLYEISNILFEEYKLVPYTYTIDHYDEIEHSGWDSINQTWVYWTEQVFNYTETIEDERLDWKPCKMNTFSLNSAELKENYGYMLIPKYDSKDKGDGTFNGTKIFKLTFNTPIEVTPNGFGSSGMVALLLGEIEFCPYWDTLWSARKPVTITTTGTSSPANYQPLLNISYESEMQADFDDIRFTNLSDGEIAYWVESKVDSNYALVWVKLSDPITDPGSDTIRMYYGNANASDGGSTTDTFIREISGVVGAWDFNGDLLDRSGYNRDGTFNGGGYGTGQFGQCLQLTANTQYVQTSGTTGLPLGDTPRTMSLWLYRSPSALYYPYQYGESLTNNFWAIQTIPSTHALNHAGYSNDWVTGYTISDNTWTHVAFTYDGTTLTLYIDGSYYGESARSNYATTAVAPRFGNNVNGYTGLIESGRMYNTSLTGPEIADIVNNFGYVTESYPGKELVRKFIANEPTITYGATQYQADSLHYNSTSPYNFTIDSDGTLTSNRNITSADDINDTAQSISTSYLIINNYDNDASIVRNFTFTGDNLDWYQAANLSGNYSLKNASSTIETQSNGNFTTDLVAGTYWVVVSAADTSYTVSGTIYGAARLGEGQVTVTLGSDSTTTSSSGSYSFTNISSGTYTLTASKPGLQDASTTITVSGDTTQDLTMALATSPGGGGQQSSDWALPFNISTPISRLDGLFTSLQVPSDPGKINLFWYCILGFGAFMFVDGTAFHFDKSRNNPVFKLKYRISAPLSLTLMFLGLLYIGLINWNSAFFINTLDWLAHSSITQPAILGIGILLLGVFVFIDGTTFHFDKSRNNPVIKLKYRISAPLSLILIFIGLLYTGMINWNSEFFIRVFDWAAFSSITGPAMLGTVILLLGILVFIDGLAFYLDKSRKSTFLKIKYQVLITTGLGLGILGAVISKLLIFS